MPTKGPLVDSAAEIRVATVAGIRAVVARNFLREREVDRGSEVFIRI